ncbi:MAG: hypothetical protein VX940_07230 [Pseudomonadota bacterium]|nr:hypothetical protein [Pseudomonadota bacterium]
MSSEETKLPETNEQTEVRSQLDQQTDLIIPLFRRDIKPSNLVLSASDLREFAELISEANDRSREIEFQKREAESFETDEDARKHIKQLMPIEYRYVEKNGNSAEGLGVPNVDERTFPEDMNTIFISNASFAERAVNRRPGNTVEAFIAFDRPTLKMDLITLPSNPTENRSVINVAGNDEAWVIATYEKIKEFFAKKRATRPVIHGSGAYDSFIYFLFLPSLLWVFFKSSGAAMTQWINAQTVFFNVLIAIYVLLLFLLIGRFLFQYIRWLFPPMEYYKKSKTVSGLHRATAGLVLSAIFLSALYDILRHLLFAVIL